MKKTYFRPEIDISVFATEDIITTSSISGMESPTALDDAAYDTTYDELFK